jgi:NADPH-dependent F420 reductase
MGETGRMRIALLGGTGEIGEALAVRWAHHTDHEVLVGSRDPANARDAVDRYEATLDAADTTGTIKGFANEMATDRADIVVLAVPAYHLADTIAAVADRLADDAIVVTPAVGMKRDEAGFHYNPPPAGSVTALAADAVPEGTTLVGAFHNLAAGRLADLDASFEWDTLVFGNDSSAKAQISRLAEAIDGVRAVDVGGLENAAEVEALTPLLINVAQENEGMHQLGVRLN